jgi:hypothetical protein
MQVTKALTKLKFFQEKLNSSEDGTAALATATVAELLNAAAAAVAGAKQQLQDSSDSGQTALALSTTALEQLSAASDAAAEHTAALMQRRAAVAAAAAAAEAEAAAAQAAEQQRVAEVRAEKQRVIDAYLRREAVVQSGMQLLKARDRLLQYSTQLQWRCGAEPHVLLDGLTGREVVLPTRKRARVELIGPLPQERWRLSNRYADGYNGYSWEEEEGEFCSRGGNWEFCNSAATATAVDAGGQLEPVLCRLPSEVVVCGSGEARDDSDAFSDRYDEAAAAADDVDGMVIVEPVYSAAVRADLDTLAAATAATADENDGSSAAVATAHEEQAEGQQADDSDVQQSSSAEGEAATATAATATAAAASDDAAVRATLEQQARQLALDAMRKRKLQS